MKKRNLVVSWLVDILIILVVFLLIIEIFSILRFRNTANNVMSKLSLLNNSVLADIPHPHGVTWLNNNNILLGPANDPARVMYDARSETRYRTNNISTEFIVDYYKKFFASQSWKQDWQIDGSDVNGHNSYGFHKGTLCAALNFDPTDFTIQSGEFSSYTITIWHDFWRQTFSPFSPLGVAKFLIRLRYVVPRCPRQIF